jgi:type VI secretion system protein VasG
MISVNLKELVAKLDDTCRRTLEGAAGLCLSRTNYNVEIEHWLMKLLEVSNTDLQTALRAFGVEAARLNADLTRAIDKLKTGNARPPALSENIVDLIRGRHARRPHPLRSSSVRAPVRRFAGPHCRRFVRAV